MSSLTGAPQAAGIYLSTPRYLYCSAGSRPQPVSLRVRTRLLSRMCLKVFSLLLISCTLALATGRFAAALDPDHDAALDHHSLHTVTLGNTVAGRKMLETTVSDDAHLRSLQQGGAAEEFDKDCWNFVGDDQPCDVGATPYCCDSQNPTKASACQGPADNTILCTDQYGAAYLYGWCKNNIC